MFALFKEFKQKNRDKRTKTGAVDESSEGEGEEELDLNDDEEDDVTPDLTKPKKSKGSKTTKKPAGEDAFSHDSQSPPTRESVSFQSVSSQSMALSGQRYF